MIWNEFDRLVLTYGADVCAIEMAKYRAIASAVEPDPRRLDSDVAEWHAGR